MQLEVFLGNFKYFSGLIAYIYGIAYNVKKREFCSASGCLGCGEWYLDEYHDPSTIAIYTIIKELTVLRHLGSHHKLDPTMS